MGSPSSSSCSMDEPRTKHIHYHTLSRTIVELWYCEYAAALYNLVSKYFIS